MHAIIFSSKKGSSVEITKCIFNTFSLIEVLINSFQRGATDNVATDFSPYFCGLQTRQTDGDWGEGGVGG